MEASQKRYHLFVFFSFLLIILLKNISVVYAEEPYIKGTVTDEKGNGFGSNISVSLSCQGSGWNYASAWGYTDKNSAFKFKASDSSYNPCSSQYKDSSWSSCELYAYQWSDKNYASNSKKVPVTIKCSQTLVQDVAFEYKSKTAVVSVKTNATPKVDIIEGVNVSCYQNESPWDSAYITKVDKDGKYTVPLLGGTYRCQVSCDWSNSSCLYVNAKEKTVTFAATDTIKDVEFLMDTKNKKIRVGVYAGKKLVTDGIQVSCSQQEYPYSYGSDKSANSSGYYEIDVTDGKFYCSSSSTSWPSKYSGYPSEYVTVKSTDSTVDTSLYYTVKDKLVRVKIYRGSTQVTSGMTANCYQQGGSYDSTSDSSSPYEMEVGTGTYNCSAYCNDWNNCDQSGYATAKVVLTDDDADNPVDVQLTFLEDNSTLAGVVTDGTNPIANVYVSINAYQVSSGGGVAGYALKRAEVTGGKADTTQVYKSAQTDSNGAFNVKLPEGTYTVQVWPPWDRKDLSQVKQEITTTAKGLTSLTLTMQKKTAKFKVTVSDEKGNPVNNTYISASSSEGGDYLWGQTDSKGVVELSAVDKRNYNITASVNNWNDSSSTLCRHTLEGTQSFIASQDSVQTVYFTVPFCDCKATVTIVDEGGEITDAYGSVQAKPVTAGTYDWNSVVYGWIGGGPTVLKVEPDVEYEYKLWFYDTGKVPAEPETATCTNGAVAVDLGTEPVIEDAVTGSYVDSDGKSIELTNTNWISVYATKNGNYRYCSADRTSFSCDLSKGKHSFGYWIEPSSGYASAYKVEENEVEVTSGGIVKDIVLLKTGTIDLTVLDLDLSGKSGVSLTCSPYSASHEGETVNDHYWYGSGWCQTNGDGSCSMNVAAHSDGTDYYCNASIHWDMLKDENLNNPEEVKVTVYPGKTIDAILEYGEPDGFMLVKVIEEGESVSSVTKPFALMVAKNAEEVEQSPASFAIVDCFTAVGGSYEETTNEEDTALIPCTTDDTWHCVANNKVGNGYYLSEATQMECAPAEEEPVEKELELKLVTTTPPKVSQTITDPQTQSILLEMEDGASAYFDPKCFDATQVTCSADTTITPFTAKRVPASFYAYQFICLDENNVELKQLNCEATITMPINVAQSEKLGIDDDTIECSYWDDSIGDYVAINDFALENEVQTIAEQEVKKVSFKTNHLTDYVVVGNGKLGAITGVITGEDNGTIGLEDETDVDDEGNNAGGDDTGSDDDGNKASGGSGGGWCSLSTDRAANPLVTIFVALALISLLICRGLLQRHGFRQHLYPTTPRKGR